MSRSGAETTRLGDWWAEFVRRWLRAFLEFIYETLDARRHVTRTPLTSGGFAKLQNASHKNIIIPI